MRLELVVFAFVGVVVPYISAQMDMLSLMQMSGVEMPRLPPTPPKSLFPYLYQSNQQPQSMQSSYQQLLLQKQQQLKEAQQKQRQQQELALLTKLRSMAAADIKALQQRLTPEQLKQLVSRIKYLQQLEQQQQQGGAASNIVTSGANRIRPPGENSVSDSGPILSVSPATTTTAPSTAALSPRARYIQAMLARFKEKMATVRQQMSPLMMLRKYQSYQKNSMNAMNAGCNYPMATEGSMETFMAFSGGGCMSGGAVCMMNGQSCVDVGMSIMCCPPGYTGTTLDAMNYMRQMESFMGQFA